VDKIFSFGTYSLAATCFNTHCMTQITDVVLLLFYDKVIEIL